MVYSYWKNAPIITVDQHTIKFGDQTYYFKDIKDIALTGKMPFRYIINFPMEGTALVFNDGRKMLFFDDMYSNSWEVKSCLEQAVVKKQSYSPIPYDTVDRYALRFEDEEIFKGNQFTSLRGISLWGLILFFTYLLFSTMETPKTGLLVFFGVFVIFWFVLHTWLMHYFGLSKDYLVVRNHNFFWMVKVFRLTDIKEIVYETQGKQPNCLRVITKDFKNKLYPAGTLRDKTWLELKDKLEAQGVTVRNKSIF